MKKHIKKLDLKKRTVSNLCTREKQMVHGGIQGTVPVDCSQQWSGCDRPSDTCLCGPTFWKNCETILTF
jgi:hypothetical protein